MRKGTSWELPAPRSGLGLCRAEQTECPPSGTLCGVCPLGAQAAARGGWLRVCSLTCADLSCPPGSPHSPARLGRGLCRAELACLSASGVLCASPWAELTVPLELVPVSPGKVRPPLQAQDPTVSTR